MIKAYGPPLLLAAMFWGAIMYLTWAAGVDVIPTERGPKLVWVSYLTMGCLVVAIAAGWGRYKY